MTLGITKEYSPNNGDTTNSTNYNTDIAKLFDSFSGLEGQTSTLGGLTITPTANDITKFKITNSSALELLSVDTTNSYLKLKATAKLYFDGGSTTYLHEASDGNVGLNAANLGIDATQKLYLDGDTCAGTTYISETSDGVVGVVAADLTIDTTKKLYFGGDTYISETSSDIMDIYVGGTNIIKITESTTDTVKINNANLAITNDPSAKRLYFDGGGDTWVSYSNEWTVGGNIVFTLEPGITGLTGGTGSAGAGNTYVELKIAGVRYKLLTDGTI